MKNKKAQWWIFGVIFAVIVLILIITVLVIAYQKGYLIKKDENKQESTINLYLRATDLKTSKPINANYILDYTSNGSSVIVKQGELTNSSPTEILNVPSNRILHAYCWADDYYMLKAVKQFNQVEKDTNASLLSCDMIPTGNITINCDGNLNEETNTIKCNITSKGWYYKLSVCTEWSAGIISVMPTSSMITCDNGNWMNWSEYNEEKDKYTWFENNQYRCGQETIEICEYAEENLCKPPTLETPYRYSGKVDSCHYFGKSLNDESYEVEFQIRTLPYKNSLDYVKFYFMDKDRRYSPEDNWWVWMTEYENKNIGNPSDAIYEIKYGE